MHGVLDQGYYSDGIMTPAQEQEYEKDILRMKELGFEIAQTAGCRIPYEEYAAMKPAEVAALVKQRIQEKIDECV